MTFGQPRSRANTRAYDANYDRTFGKQEKKQHPPKGATRRKKSDKKRRKQS